MRKTFIWAGLLTASLLLPIYPTSTKATSAGGFQGEDRGGPAVFVEPSLKSADALAEDPTTAPMPPSSRTAQSTRTLCWFMPDQNNQPIPNSTLRFTTRAVERSGGHDHHSAARPTMTFSINGGAATADTGTQSTGSTGRLCVKYIAPQVSGNMQITVNGTRPDGQSGTTVHTIPVKVNGLTQLGKGNNYVLVGSTPTHVSNHWGTQGTNAALIKLANDYAAKFPGGKLNYNDMSLVWGGLFDINATWTNPHINHRLGTNLDFAILAVPPARRSAVQQLIKGLKFTILDESDHWHLTYTLSGGAAQQRSPTGVSATPPPGEAQQASAAGLNVEATVAVTNDAAAGTYTYRYSFRNASTSTLEVSEITILLNNSTAFEVRAPQGWTSRISEDGASLLFAATEGVTVPPGFSDEGQLLPSPYQIKPGTTLGDFSFVSLDQPAQTDFFAEGFEQIAELGEDDTLTPPPDFAGTTQGPKYTLDTSTNPINDTRFFLRQHYQDFLNREPDLSGFKFWSGDITSCGTDAACREFRRVNTSGAFFLSIEFQQTGYLIYRLNKASFGGMPRYLSFLDDTQIIGRDVVVGAAGWEQRLEDNTKAFIDAWVARDEFKNSYDPMTPAQYVDALFSHAGVTPGAAERDALISGLSSGTETRATALRKVADNAMLRQKEFNRAFVLMQYFGYLRRNPDDEPDNNLDGFNFWLGKLDQFGGDFHRAEMVKAFLDSIEYKQRFGQ